MASLEILKHALRQHVMSSDSSTIVQPLPDSQYSVGFELLLRSSIESTYKQFITPQLSRLLFSIAIATGDERVSVLEIGPGPESVLGLLPGHLRRKIRNYRAFEPNKLFAERLKTWLCVGSFGECPLPCLDAAPVIHEEAFTPSISTATIPNGSQDDTQYDIILFCHSMYGMKPHCAYMQKALEMLSYRDKSLVIVFHRDIPLDFGGLVCQQRSSFPTGIVTIEDKDEVLDTFSAFIAGYETRDTAFGESTRAEWRNICRTLGHAKRVKANRLSFSSPNIMIAFGRSAKSLPELLKMVPLIKGEPRVKNREALFNGSAAIVQPTEVRHLQHCVQWALKHGLSVTIIGGGHSGQCLQPSTVAVDMSAFNDIHLILASDVPPTTAAPIDTGLVVVGAGCRVGDIIHATMAACVTVPLGARPSVGAGSWLQGGIGHLARLHGLSSDAIVGAVMVSVENGQLLCVGTVPTQHAPADAVHPNNHDELLWMLKGAGTNCGIVVTLVFKLAPARMYLVRNWIIPLSDTQQARQRLSHFDTLIAQDLPEDCAADAYIFCVEDQLQLGIALYETTTRKTSSEAINNTSSLGPEQSRHFVDSIGVFDTEMYVSGMHGGHGGGKTSTFKRCMFLKEIGAAHIADILISALQNRPSPMCYVHLLQGGGMVRNVAPSATAFGCRDWDFACVITGVWPRDQDGTALAQTVVDWVYAVAENILPVSSGAYGADLGPDPRDVSLALTSFGPNRIRLARLKSRLDPNHVLAYTCPIIGLQMGQKLIFIISGDAGAGKDHCTDIWASMLTSAPGLSPYAVRTVSISAATKSEYAIAAKADLRRLLWDRAYKEQHRPALAAFLGDQLQKRPCLFKEHFLEVVRDAADATVLFVTGMRDEAPVAILGHLLPERRIIEVRVEASWETRQTRRGYPKSPGQEDPQSPTVLTYRPSLTFDNNAQGDQAAVDFAHRHLFPYVGEDLQRLRDMVRTATNFPKPGVVFQHILGICEQRSGLQLCTSLFQNLFAGNWAQVDAIVSCETGGFIFASALAAQVNVPLVLIRETGKLPPPTVSCVTSRSHISSLSVTDEKRLEMAAGVFREGASVVVVDDTFATGATLLAMLKLLEKAGVALDDISAMVVAELPVHRGREFLHQSGFGRISLQSLLVFGGV